MAERVHAGLTRQEKRKFGLTVGPAFLVIAGILLWRDHETPATVCAVLGGSLVLVALVMPGILGPVYRGWMAFGAALNKVTTPIVMGLMYFVVFAPIGLIMRAFGRNPMVRAPGESYWVTRPEGRRQSDLNRQF